MIDLETGQVKVLQLELSADMLNRKEGAYFAFLDGDYARLHILQRSAQNPISTWGNTRSMADPVQDELHSPTYDLRTGQKATHVFSGANDEYKLTEPGWGVNSRYDANKWPNLLNSLPKFLRQDLDILWPLSPVVNVQFMNMDTNEIRYQKRFYFSVHKARRTFASQDGQSVVTIVEPPGPGTHLYRWKVPFAVYSIWWSIAAGCVPFLLLMLLRQWALRRTPFGPPRLRESHTAPAPVAAPGPPVGP